MNHSHGPGPADRRRLDALIRCSNAVLYPAITGFVDGGHRRIVEALRGALPPDAAVQHFLDELRLMQDYVGTSYRVSQISSSGLAALHCGLERQFADRGVQCAFVLPGDAAAWAAHAAEARLRDGAYRLFSIFDESVPQKNLSTPQCADHVVVLPATPLRLKALRIVAAHGPANPGKARIVAHFTRADRVCGTPYDLYSGAPDRIATPDLPQPQPISACDGTPR
jgi:hypothetical protein